MLYKFIRHIASRYFDWDAKNKLEKYGSNVQILGKIFIMNPNVIIEDDVVLYPGVSFLGDGEIYIGKGVKIGQNCVISANKKGGIKIGDYTIIAAMNYIIDSNHNFNIPNELIQKSGMDTDAISIGSDVWIGTQCSILKGTKIENGSIIGANSVVNSDILSGLIAVGSPAKIIKQRYVE